MNRPDFRSAFSLLEVVLAGVILSLALLPILGNFQQLFRGLKKTQDATHAAFLAQAIMENIRYRLYDGDERFFRLDQVRSGKRVPDGDPRVGHINEPADELDRRICARDYERFFLELTEEGVSVRVAPGLETSRFFLDFTNVQRSGLHGITAQSHPRLWRELEGYRVLVEVRLSVPESAIDSDGDGNIEIDMAEIIAVVSWSASDGTPMSREYATVFTRHQYNPWPKGPACAGGFQG